MTEDPASSGLESDPDLKARVFAEHPLPWILEHDHIWDADGWAVLSVHGSGVSAEVAELLVNLVNQDAGSAVTPMGDRVTTDAGPERSRSVLSSSRSETVTARDQYPLGSLGLKIKAHWRKHRPKMYAALEKSGHLRASLYAAQELTSKAMYDLEVVKKLPHDQAWELVREEWAFVPSEDDVPALGFDPAAPRACPSTRRPTCGNSRRVRLARLAAVLPHARHGLVHKVGDVGGVEL